MTDLKSKLSFYERKFADSVINMYPSYTDKAIASKLGTSAKTVNKIAKKLSLKRPKQSEMKPDEFQRDYILKNALKMSYKKMSEHLGVPRHIVTRWVKELFSDYKMKKPYKTTDEMIEHYYNLCLWYLRGFSLRNIVVSYSGVVTEEDIRKAITFDNGKLLKKCYFKIKFAGNDVYINDDSHLGLVLKKRVKQWDEYLSKFEVKAS
ncbi:MAG: hypothetical protein E7396_00930 [Ruminococcaceae bacterium]|nr:hypothetical protein [Oscillospiraceae bacterium]